MRFQILVREIGSLAGNRKERYKDMLKRVVYGVLAGSAVIFAILCLPKFIGNILVTLLAIGGTNEFIKAMEKGGYKPLKAIPYLTCLGLLFVNGESSIMAYKISFSIFSFLILIILIYAFFMTKRTLVDVCLSCFAMLYIPFLLSFVLNTYYFDDIGTYAIWFILFGACCPLSFAFMLILVLFIRLANGISMTKLLYVKTMGDSRGIGVFNKMQGFLAQIGLISNLCVIFFTNKNFAFMDLVSKLLYLIIIENLIFFALNLVYTSQKPFWYRFKEFVEVKYLKYFGIRPKNIKEKFEQKTVKKIIG